MNDQEPLDQRNLPEEKESEILINEYGETRDPAVVVDEPNRTVLLTQDETIVIDKEPRIDVVPSNRPRKVYGGMWGPPELVTVAFAMVAVFIVAMIYIFMVAPAKRELETNRARRDQLESELISAREKYGKITNTEEHVAKLMSSVDDFESINLPDSTNGRTSLYQRINNLISGYGLVNTTGPDYAPLETVEQGNGVESEEERGRSKLKSLFPGVYVSMTVEGSYQSIRRFIRDIETGDGFVVVSAVELQPSDAEKHSDGQAQQNSEGHVISPGKPAVPGGLPKEFQNGLQGGAQNPGLPQPQSNRNKGKSHGEVVSLRLEMAAYFRRPNAIPAVAAPTEQPQ
jgi:Tfp pilus assembly protein PilO